MNPAAQLRKIRRAKRALNVDSRFSILICPFIPGREYSEFICMNPYNAPAGQVSCLHVVFGEAVLVPEGLQLCHGVVLATELSNTLAVTTGLLDTYFVEDVMNFFVRSVRVVVLRNLFMNLKRYRFGDGSGPFLSWVEALPIALFGRSKPLR